MVRHKQGNLILIKRTSHHHSTSQALHVGYATGLVLLRRKSSSHRYRYRAWTMAQYGLSRATWTETVDVYHNPDGEYGSRRREMSSDNVLNCTCHSLLAVFAQLSFPLSQDRPNINSALVRNDSVPTHLGPQDTCPLSIYIHFVLRLETSSMPPHYRSSYSLHFGVHFHDQDGRGFGRRYYQEERRCSPSRRYDPTIHLKWSPVRRSQTTPIATTPLMETSVVMDTMTDKTGCAGSPRQQAKTQTNGALVRYSVRRCSRSTAEYTSTIVVLLTST